MTACPRPAIPAGQRLRALFSDFAAIVAGVGRALLRAPTTRSSPPPDCAWRLRDWHVIVLGPRPARYELAGAMSRASATNRDESECQPLVAASAPRPALDQRHLRMPAGLRKRCLAGPSSRVGLAGDWFHFLHLLPARGAIYHVGASTVTPLLIDPEVNGFSLQFNFTFSASVPACLRARPGLAWRHVHPRGFRSESDSAR